MSTSYISTRYVHSDQILGPWTYYYGFQLRMGAGIDWFSPLILLSMYILTQIATSALRYLVKATFRTRCNAGVCRLRCRCVTPQNRLKAYSYAVHTRFVCERHSMEAPSLDLTRIKQDLDEANRLLALKKFESASDLLASALESLYVSLSSF